MPLLLTAEPITWTARYCWSPERGGPGLTVRHFRREVLLAAVPSEVRVHITADSRYRLWINGQRLGHGPAKGTLAHYQVETYDLAPHLCRGVNVLAAEVRWFGANAPMSEIHAPWPGWLVHAPDHPEWSTPGGWRVRVDRSVTPDTTPYHENAHEFLNHTEHVDLRATDGTAWRGPGYDDRAWAAAEPIGAAVNAGAAWAVADERILQPRDIPALTEEPRRFASVVQPGRIVPSPFRPGGRPWRIAARMPGELVLDAGEMTTAFPILTLSGGRGRELRVTYAEALGFWHELPDGRRIWKKERRDDPAGVPHGYRDTLLLSGRSETFETFHWRAFRYLKIEVLPGPEPLEIQDVHFRLCVYPQLLQADFASSDPDSAALWQTSWRTARLCAHETYEDCPYFEQLSYVADTREQALLSYHLANETRLARRSLRFYRDSLGPDGFIGSRVPSVRPQRIPYFTFYWVLMLEEYWRWVGAPDRDFVQSCLPVVDHVLATFRSRLTPDHWVGQLPLWNMVDQQSGWLRGEPPVVQAGRSTFITALYIQALEAAMRLHAQAGRPEDADRWRPWPDRLRHAIREAWSETDGLFLEGIARGDDPPSQHSQCAALLARVPTPHQRQRLLHTLRHDDGLLKASLMQSHAVAEVYAQHGLYDLFHERLLQPWRRMLQAGATTWWEYPEVTRSDCHAWSSWVAVDFLNTVLGMRAGAPGWTSIRIAPVTDGLSWARGGMTTPAGRIEVSWRRQDEQLVLEAVTPLGVPVEFDLPGHPLLHGRGGAFRWQGRIGAAAELQRCPS